VADLATRYESERSGTIPDVLGVPIRVHDMTGDDLGIAHVPTPVETGDLILFERGDYRVRDVIFLEDEQPSCTPSQGHSRHVNDHS
jgi:hypothetical protein